MTTRTQVLALHDKGERAADIAEALGVTPGHVFGILRDERPDRTHGNKGRRTSELRAMIKGLAAQGIEPARIAFLLQRSCSRAYVYRILGE